MQRTQRKENWVDNIHYRTALFQIPSAKSGTRRAETLPEDSDEDGNNGGDNGGKSKLAKVSKGKRPLVKGIGGNATGKKSSPGGTSELEVGNSRNNGGGCIRRGNDDAIPLGPYSMRRRIGTAVHVYGADRVQIAVFTVEKSVDFEEIAGMFLVALRASELKTFRDVKNWIDDRVAEANLATDVD